MNAGQLHDEILRLSKQLGKANIDLAEAGVTYAYAEHAYRQAKATQFLLAEGKTVREREAEMDRAVSDERLAALLADAAKVAALELVRSLRAQLSGTQTVANAYRAEAEFARTGPEGF